MSKPESVARVLTVQERVLLFCVGSGTDLLWAGVTGHTVQVGIVKGIVIRDGQDQQLALTELGRKVLAEVGLQPGRRGDLEAGSPVRVQHGSDNRRSCKVHDR